MTCGCLYLAVRNMGGEPSTPSFLAASLPYLPWQQWEACLPHPVMLLLGQEFTWLWGGPSFTSAAVPTDEMSGNQVSSLGYMRCGATVTTTRPGGRQSWQRGE